MKQQEDSQNITAVFQVTVKGPVLSWTATTSSFLRIQVHPAPQLPPQAAAVQVQSFSRGSGTQRQEQDELHRQTRKKQ